MGIEEVNEIPGLPLTDLYFQKQITNKRLNTVLENGLESAVKNFTGLDKVFYQLDDNPPAFDELPRSFNPRYNWEATLWLDGKIFIKSNQFHTQSAITWLSHHASRTGFIENRDQLYNAEFLRGIVRNCFIDPTEELINIEELNNVGKIILAEALLSDLVSQVFLEVNLAVKVFEKFQTIEDISTPLSKKIKRQMQLLNRITLSTKEEETLSPNDQIEPFIKKLFQVSDRNLRFKDLQFEAHADLFIKKLNVLKEIARKRFNIRGLILNEHLSPSVRFFVNNPGKIFALAALIGTSPLLLWVLPKFAGAGYKVRPNVNLALKISSAASLFMASIFAYKSLWQNRNW